MQVTEGPHPGEHLAIALTGGGEGSRSDNPILLIHDRCDVKILMSIHAADDAARSFVYLTYGRRSKRPHPYPACAAALAQENETLLELGI